MKRIQLRMGVLIALATALGAGSVLAERPPWAGGERHDRHDGRGDDRYEQRYDRRYEGRRDDRHREQRHVFRHDPRVEDFRGGPIDFRFDDRSRGAIHDYYYGARYKHGRCPPGLVKKGNACIPPGHARKWHRGHPLPPGLVYYDLPPVLVAGLPPPPPHHRYVRVASDILLITVGTAMVIDAIEDLGRLP
jgi:hypothetical protein